MKFGTKVIIALALLANLWFVSSCNNGPKRELWLDEVYKDSCFVQDWGIPQINQSVVWTPLTVNGVVYERGSELILSAVCCMIWVVKLFQ